MPSPDELMETLSGRTEALREEIAKAIVGQQRVVEDVLLGLYCGEHVLLTGVPGPPSSSLSKDGGYFCREWGCTSIC